MSIKTVHILNVGYFLNTKKRNLSYVSTDGRPIYAKEKGRRRKTVVGRSNCIPVEAVGLIKANILRLLFLL